MRLHLSIFDEDFHTEGDSFFKGAGKAVGLGAKGCQDDGYVGVVAADVGEWGSGVHDFPVDELKEGRCHEAGGARHAVEDEAEVVFQIPYLAQSEKDRLCPKAASLSFSVS